MLSTVNFTCEVRSGMLHDYYFARHVAGVLLCFADSVYISLYFVRGEIAVLQGLLNISAHPALAHCDTVCVLGR